VKTNFDKIKPEYVYLDTISGDITITLPVGFTFTAGYNTVCIGNDPIIIVMKNDFYVKHFSGDNDNYDFDNIFQGEYLHLQDILKNVTEEEFNSQLEHDISQTLEFDKIDHIEEITKNLNKSKMNYPKLFKKNHTTQGGKQIYK